MLFAGFLPAKAGEREQAVEQLANLPHAVVLLEAPHRIEEMARELQRLGDRRVTVGRELTKQFEQITTLKAGELTGWLSQDPQRTRGEFALVLHPVMVADERWQQAEKVLGLLLAELPVKTAVRLAGEITGAPRNALYERALAIKRP